MRIREHLYNEIAARAEAERRSIIGQLEYLLEQALRIKTDADAQPRDAQARQISGGAAMDEPAAPTAARRTLPPTVPSEDLHFRPDPK